MLDYQWSLPMVGQGDLPCVLSGGVLMWVFLDF